MFIKRMFLTAAAATALATAIAVPASTAHASAAHAARPAYSYGCNGAVCITLTNDGWARVNARRSFSGHFQLLMPAGWYYNSGNRSWAAGNNVAWPRLGNGWYCAIAWQENWNQTYTNIGEACETAY